MICPVFKGCFDVLWESLRDDYSQESMGVLQNKGGWLGYEEGDDLIKGMCGGVEEVFEGGKDSTKKRGIWQNKDCDDSFHLL